MDADNAQRCSIKWHGVRREVIIRWAFHSKKASIFQPRYMQNMSLNSENGEKSLDINGPVYDRAKEIREFEARKTGVKGLVDEGITKVPSIFIVPPEYLPTKSQKPNMNTTRCQQPPMIDLQGLKTDKRGEIIKQTRQALQDWGMFCMLNHGIPLTTMNNMLEATERFHEQPKEEKMALYSRDDNKMAKFFTTAVQELYMWKDVIVYHFEGSAKSNTEVPIICREAVYDYVEQLMKLRDNLTELFSEVLGVRSEELEKIGFKEGLRIGANYYPPCPEPDLIMGLLRHTDPFFITVLLQDKTRGLQVHHQDEWVDLHPHEGVLTVFVADMLQMISNDTFRSVKHRVLAPEKEPRLSVACSFLPSTSRWQEKLTVMKDLISENNPPLYKPTSVSDYLKVHMANRSHGPTALALRRQTI